MKRKVKTIAITTALLAAASLTAADKVTFEDDVLPIFRNKCLKCHNADKMRADLDLSTYEATMNGSGNGPVLAGGDPDSSQLYKVVAHLEKPTMPPKDKLPDKEIEVIKNWVAGGLLLNAGSKAVMAAKPKVSIAIDPDSLGKRPEGPVPMPNHVLALDPYVRTARTSVSTAMAVSPWSPLIAIGGQRQVLLYNTDTLRVAGIIPFNEGYPHSLKFSANGKMLVIGGGRGANLGISTVWDVTQGKRLVTVGDDLDAVLASDLSPDQRFIAHGGPDRFLRIFSTETGEVMHKIKKHTDWVTAVRFSPNGKYVASGDRNGGLHVWETEPGGRAYSSAHGNRIVGFEWASTNIVVSASMDGSAKMFNVDQARQIRSWGVHSGGAMSLSRSTTGHLVTSGRNKRASLWNSSGTKIRDFVFPGDIPAQAVPSHDAKLVIGSDWNGDIFVWNAADAKLVSKLSLNPAPIAEQYAIAAKKLADHRIAAKSAADSVKAFIDKTTDATAKIAAFDKAVADTAAAKKAAGKALMVAIAAVKPAQDTAATADKAAKTDKANVEKQKAAATAKAALNKALATHKFAQDRLNDATKAATAALDAAKTGKPPLKKQIEDLYKTAAAAKKKVTEENAAVTAAQKTLDALSLDKAFADYFNAQKAFAGQEKELADLQAAAKAAQGAMDSTRAALEAAKKTDLNELKAAKLAAFNQAKAAQTEAEKALAAAKAEVAKEQPKVDAALKAITDAETGVKTATGTLTTAKAVHTKSIADAKTQRDKATAAKAAYDQLVIAKQAPVKQISASIDKALAMANSAKANAGKALAVINTEVTAANTAFAAADKSAKAAEIDAATAKTALDKLAADLAKQKTDLAAKQKAQVAAKAVYEGLIAKKQKPAEAKLAAAVKVATQAPIDKANAEKAQAAVNAEVKTALMAFLAAEMAAQAAEAAAAKDAKQKPDALAKRKAADDAKKNLDDLIAGKQKAATATVAKMTTAAAAAPIAKAAAEKELIAVKAEVAKTDTAHKTAIKAATDAQTLVTTTTANLTKAQVDHKTKATTATAQRTTAKGAKATLDGVIAAKQKPAQEAVNAAGVTVTELTAAKAAAVKVAERVAAELVEANKPVQAAMTVATTTEVAVKAADENVTKMTVAVEVAKKLVTTRQTEATAAKAAMAKMMEAQVKPMEDKLIAATSAVSGAKTAHDNTEKNHQAHIVSLGKTIETQTDAAKTKQGEAEKFAATVAAAKKKLEELKAAYEKLKPAKTAAK